MINQMSQNDHTPNKFSDAFMELQIGKLMRKSNITKSCGISAYEVFQFLLLLAFQGKNLFRFLNSKHKDQAVSKNTYYRSFNMLSFDNKSNRYNEVSSHIDPRTNGYKFRKESMMHKTDAAVLLIKNALKAGIQADYVLMDTWFTTEPMIAKILETGMDAIGMVKQLKQRYTCNGKQYKLPELKKFVNFEGARNIFGSLVVTTKTGIPVKILFVRNRNKKSECLYILSTDLSLSDAEIVRIYGNRWPIECFFKSSKSFLKLGTEFQSHNYGAKVSHTTIVFTRNIILEWIRRNLNDQKTYGEIFFMFCEDIQNMDLANALQSLMALLVEHIGALSADMISLIKSKVTEWMMSQTSFIRSLFGNIGWES